VPSSNVRDGLPAHYDRVRQLRRIAEAVIRSLPRTARRPPIRVTAMRQAPAAAPDVRQDQRRALPGSPSHPYIEADARAERLRERLRADGQTDG